ncbi:MAG: hypothetical protein DKINENOH_04866 [bacterium]|nr:hypothetical protein [bacterium]
MDTAKKKSIIVLLLTLPSLTIICDVVHSQNSEYLIPPQNFNNFAPYLTQQYDREKWLCDNNAKPIQFTDEGYWPPKPGYYVVYRFRSIGYWFGPSENFDWQQQALNDLDILKERLSQSTDPRIREAIVDVRVFKKTISPGDSIPYGFDDGEVANKSYVDNSTPQTGGLKSEKVKKGKKATPELAAKKKNEDDTISERGALKADNIATKATSTPGATEKEKEIAAMPGGLEPEEITVEKKADSQLSSDDKAKNALIASSLEPIEVQKDKKAKSKLPSGINIPESLEISPSFESNNKNGTEQVYAAFLDVVGLHPAIQQVAEIISEKNTSYFRYLYIKKAFVRDNGESELRTDPLGDIGLSVRGGPTFKDPLNGEGVRLLGPFYNGMDEKDNTPKFEWDDYCMGYYNNFCLVDLTNYRYEFIRLLAMEGDHEHSWDDYWINVGKVALSPAGTTLTGAAAGAGIGALTAGPVGAVVGGIVGGIAGLFGGKAAGVDDVFKDDCVFYAEVSLSDLSFNDEIVVTGNCDIPGQCAELTLKLVTPSKETKMQPGLFWNRTGLKQRGVMIHYSDCRVVVKNLTGKEIDVFVKVYTDFEDGQQDWTEWIGPFLFKSNDAEPHSLRDYDGWIVKGYKMHIYAESRDGLYVWDEYKNTDLNIRAKRPMEYLSNFTFTFR